VFSFNQYNGYSSYIQGRLASKGLITLTLYEVNKKLYGENTYKCSESPLKEDFLYAIIAGNLSIQTTDIKNGGIAYTEDINQNITYLKSDIESNECQFVKDSNIINFDSEEQKMNNLSKQLALFEDNGVVI